MGLPPSDTVLLRRLAPLACAGVGAVAFAVLGAGVGVLLAFTVPVVTSFWSDFAEVQAGAMVAALVLIPFGSAAAGFVGGLVFAGAFNAVARWTGGVRVAIERPPVERPLLPDGESPGREPPAAPQHPAVPDEASW